MHMIPCMPPLKIIINKPLAECMDAGDSACTLIVLVPRGCASTNKRVPFLALAATMTRRRRSSHQFVSGLSFVVDVVMLLLRWQYTAVQTGRMRLHVLLLVCKYYTTKGTQGSTTKTASLCTYYCKYVASIGSNHLLTYKLSCFPLLLYDIICSMTSPTVDDLTP